MGRLSGFPLPAWCECQSHREVCKQPGSKPKRSTKLHESSRTVGKILRMHRTKIIVLSLLCCWAVCSAQDKDSKPNAAVSKPDLSGTWVFDFSQSDVGQVGSNPDYDELILEIVHHEPELKILRRWKKKKGETSQKLLYHSDKRRDTNLGIDGDIRVRSRTHWEGAVLVTSGTISRFFGEVALQTEMTERWELTPDGNTLKQTGSYKTTFFDKTRRSWKSLRVFKRVP